MFAIIASAVAVSAAIPVHSADISHVTSAYQAEYQTQSTIHFREVETRFANRPSVPVCRWQAELVVQRSVTAQGQPVAAFAKPIHRFTPLSGSHAGTCEAARNHIQAKVERHARALGAKAASAAQQDRVVLISELDGVHALTAMGG